MIVLRLLAHVAIGGLALTGAAFGQPLEGGDALVLPTPEGPKLSVPEIASPPPPLTLQHARPLQIQPQVQRPRLNVLPGRETAEPADEDAEESEAGEAPPSLHLQHTR